MKPKALVLQMGISVVMAVVLAGCNLEDPTSLDTNNGGAGEDIVPGNHNNRDTADSGDVDSGGDEGAPTVTIISAPEGVTSETVATIEFACDIADCLYRCALDDAPFEACTSPVVYEGLQPGAHSFEVRASDRKGRESAGAFVSWQINDALQVIVTSGPEEKTYASRAEFEFTCDGDCTFECALDGEAFEPCTSPTVYEGLEEGAHRFVVRASDDAGSQGSSAPYEWEIVGPEWVQVAAGGAHTCGRLEDGTVWCWGDGGEGQLGRSGVAASLVPLQVGDDADWDYIAAGSSGSCGIRQGELYCWGNVRGGAPIGGSVLRRFDGTGWTTISVSGGDHYCGIRDGGQLWCWGTNNDGQVGNGQYSTSVLNPVRVGSATDWRAVAVGGAHSCGIRGEEGLLYCWGNDEEGQTGLGLSDAPYRQNTPDRVGSLMNVVEVSLGFRHSLGVLDLSESAIPPYSAGAWGSNEYGELGLELWPPFRINPTYTADLRYIAAGTSFSCGISYDEQTMCTGRNNKGQLGAGDRESSDRWILVAPEKTFVAISAGDRHACGIDDSHQIWCWGSNQSGQLGTGDQVDQHVPVQLVF